MTADEIVVDLNRITIREFRSLFDRSQEQADEDGLIAKVCGITTDELLDLPQPEYRKLIQKFFAAAKQPLADPN